MNLTQAKAAMQKLIGKRAMWRYNEKAPTSEQRDEIRATIPALKSAKEAAEAAYQERRKVLLADPEYCRLRDAYSAAVQEWENARSLSYAYRVTIGRDDGIAMMVLAQGDNWQDAIDKLESTKVTA